MDRGFAYTNQIPLSTQALLHERRQMIGLGMLAQAVNGTATVADGLNCVPTVPASLSVQLTPGSMYALTTVDAAKFSALDPDVSHVVIKQGIELDPTVLTLVAPGLSGYSVNHLIQAAVVESDEEPTVVPYVNPNNLNLPFSGPSGTGQRQPTVRRGRIQISAKSGTLAPTGTQTTPSPDAGFSPLYVVTIAFGDTAIPAASIATHPSNPFLYKKLPELPLWAQSGDGIYGLDKGTTANAIVVTLSPAPSSMPRLFLVRKNALTSTGAVSINVNGLGAVALQDRTGAPLGAGNLPGNVLMLISYDGTACRLLNGAISQASLSSINLTTGEGVKVGGSPSYTVALDFSTLTTGTPAGPDLFGFFDNEGQHHLAVSLQQLQALTQRTGASGLINIQVITASGSYVPSSPAVKHALAFVTGGGGAGGHGGEGAYNGAGGGAGATALAYVNVSTVTANNPIPVTVGLGGDQTRQDGGDSIFGPSTAPYAYAGGGKAGAQALLPAGGKGGVATAGVLLLNGSGGYTNTWNGYGDMGGNGADSFWGGAGRGQDYNVVPDGIGEPAFGYGSGGGGGDKRGVGGRGADGVVVVLEFA